MLTLHSCTGAVAGDLSAIPPGAVWIDLLDPTADEIARVEAATGLHVPSLAELGEIERSSRLRSEGGVLYLSTPVVFRRQPITPESVPETTSVGFVLSPTRLITVRFVELVAFTSFAGEAAIAGRVQPSGAGAFAGLVEAMVDRMADVLEEVGSDLDAISLRVFRATETKPKRPAREDLDLRQVVRRIGRNGDLASKIRDSLLGLGRLVPYAAATGRDWIPAEVLPRFEIQRQDIASLSDYDAHLTNKVQLLLDATMGLINIEQNNIIKVLTVVSVVGVPPTFIASLYGMNFHNMAEYGWTYGYQYGLAMIALSAIGPLVWFRLRGWL